MYVWKFTVSGARWVPLPSNPDVSVKGHMSIAMAATEQKAREAIRRYANEFGFDARWLEVASVTMIEPALGIVLGWAEV